MHSPQTNDVTSNGGHSSNGEPTPDLCSVHSVSSQDSFDVSSLTYLLYEAHVMIYLCARALHSCAGCVSVDLLVVMENLRD